MIKSKVIIEDSELMIEHEECSDPSWCRDKQIFVESNSNENNTLSTVTFNGYLSIYVFWESHTSANSLEVLYVPETGIIFIGCGNISARISTKESKLLDLDYVDLFWGLDRHNDYILETGELQCFLYDVNGNKIPALKSTLRMIWRFLVKVLNLSLLLPAQRGYTTTTMANK